MDVESEEAFNGAEIADCISLRELRVEMIDSLDGICENKEIVNINSDDCNLISFLKNKNGFICIRLPVTKF